MKSAAPLMAIHRVPGCQWLSGATIALAACAASEAATSGLLEATRTGTCCKRSMAARAIQRMLTSWLSSCRVSVRRQVALPAPPDL